jgi:hypothetical protein
MQDEKEGKELEQLAQKLLELHIERRLKSFENLNQMLRGI